MNLVQNRSISASAGTGKTFRLAHRYIGLMAAGVAPDRICALTFSARRRPRFSIRSSSIFARP